MRRKARALDKASCEEVLSSEPLGRLAVTDGEFPYVIPVFFAYHDQTIIIHSAKVGLKIDVLACGKPVCFEVDRFEGFLHAERACDCGASFDSVICFGWARLESDRARKLEFLEILCQRYARYGLPSVISKTDLVQVDATAVIAMDIHQMTGKRSHQLAPPT